MVMGNGIALFAFMGIIERGHFSITIYQRQDFIEKSRSSLSRAWLVIWKRGKSKSANYDRILLLSDFICFIKNTSLKIVQFYYMIICYKIIDNVTRPFFFSLIHVQPGPYFQISTDKLATLVTSFPVPFKDSLKDAPYSWSKRLIISFSASLTLVSPLIQPCPHCSCIPSRHALPLPCCTVCSFFLIFFLEGGVLKSNFMARGL